jgi:hypothetical protein
MDEAESAGSDMTRVATLYDINMQSVKKMTSADLVVAISKTADGQVVLKKTDPNQTHPHNMKELLAKVNERKQGRTCSSYDYQAICWKEKLKAETKYAWKHSNGASHVWSGDAVSYPASLTDDYFAKTRAEYQKRPKDR